MKRYIFPFLMSVLLLGVNKADAQTQARAQAKDPAMKGHFDVASHHVDYKLIPIFHNGLSVELNSTDQALYNIEIVNTAGEVIDKWSPTSANNKYRHLFKIDNFTAGSYNVRISDNNHTKLHEVAFQSKQ